MDENLRQLLENQQILFVNQIKEWVEIFTDFETRNKYQILDQNQMKLGYIAEVGSGFIRLLSRTFFGSHRPMHVCVWNEKKEMLLSFKRPFFFFFSQFTVFNGNQEVLGTVRRRFGLVYKKYDLQDQSGYTFLKVKSPLWRLWTFQLYDNQDKEVGIISKNWGGVLKEVFTDTDKFQVQFPQVDYKKKAVVLATAISIDMDFFENNQKND